MQSVLHFAHLDVTSHVLVRTDLTRLRQNRVRATTRGVTNTLEPSFTILTRPVVMFRPKCNVIGKLRCAMKSGLHRNTTTRDSEHSRHAIAPETHSQYMDTHFRVLSRPSHGPGDARGASSKCHRKKAAPPFHQTVPRSALTRRKPPEVARIECMTACVVTSAQERAPSGPVRAARASNESPPPPPFGAPVPLAAPPGRRDATNARDPIT